MLFFFTMCLYAVIVRFPDERILALLLSYSVAEAAIEAVIWFIVQAAIKFLEG